MHSERGERVWSGLVQEENGRECVWLFSFFFSFSFLFFFIFFFFLSFLSQREGEEEEKKREKEKKVRGEESNGILFFVFCFLSEHRFIALFLCGRKKKDFSRFFFFFSIFLSSIWD
jgi:hypothetical protein